MPSTVASPGRHGWTPQTPPPGTSKARELRWTERHRCWGWSTCKTQHESSLRRHQHRHVSIQNVSWHHSRWALWVWGLAKPNFWFLWMEACRIKIKPHVSPSSMFQFSDFGKLRKIQNRFRPNKYKRCIPYPSIGDSVYTCCHLKVYHSHGGQYIRLLLALYPSVACSKITDTLTYSYLSLSSK